MDKDFDFDNIGKRTPYRTPDNFFEETQRKILERTVDEQRKKRRLKRIIPTVIAVAAVLAGILFTPSLRYMNTDTPSASNILAVDKNNVTTDPVDKWIKELSDEELEVLMALFLGSQMTLSAQNEENKERKQRPTPEQMMQMQTNQMVRALMLDDATAAKFTPIYEKYLKELRECRMMNFKPRARKDADQGTEANTAKETPKPVMTDAEIAKMLKDQFAQSRKMLDIREKYYNEFSKILSQKQIMKIYQQEKSNMNKFRKEFDRRKGQKPGQGHKPGQDRQRQRQHTPHQTQK